MIGHVEVQTDNPDLLKEPIFYLQLFPRQEKSFQNERKSGSLCVFQALLHSYSSKTQIANKENPLLLHPG